MAEHDDVSAPGAAVAHTTSAASGSLAEILDRVVWDYSPGADEPSPLLATATYFEDFPWDGEETREV